MNTTEPTPALAAADAELRAFVESRIHLSPADAGELMRLLARYVDARLEATLMPALDALEGDHR